jgi:hypothetical protein
VVEDVDDFAAAVERQFSSVCSVPGLQCPDGLVGMRAG